MRRRSLAALRQRGRAGRARGARPVPARVAARRPADARLRGADGVLRVVEQLAGRAVPASALEPLVLPARVRRLPPAMLDELTAVRRGRCGPAHGALPGDDGWVALRLADGPRCCCPSRAELELDDRAPARPRGARPPAARWFFRAARRPRSRHRPSDRRTLAAALWDLVWAGPVTNDTLAPLRALSAAAGRAPQPAPPRPPRAARPPTGAASGDAEPHRAADGGRPLVAAARARRRPHPPARTPRRAAARPARRRHPRRGDGRARSPGGFAGVYRCCRRSRSPGAAGAATSSRASARRSSRCRGAIDRLRAFGARPRDAEQPTAVVLAATDPANPYGAALPWPERPARRHRPPPGSQGRRAGRAGGRCAGPLRRARRPDAASRGPTTLWSCAAPPPPLPRRCAAEVLGRLTVQKADGESVLSARSPLGSALEAAGFTATPQGLRLRR